jgi:hypothetical protein
VLALEALLLSASPEIMFVQLKKLLLCLILLSNPIALYGQAPTPPVNADKPKQQTINPHKQSSPEQRGTEQAPMVIKILPPTESKEPTANPDPHENDMTHWAEQWLQHWPEILLALFTLGLWVATAQLVSGAKDTARRQLRAYISITSVRKVPNTLNASLPAYEIDFRNSGQTPAYAIKTWRAIGTSRKPLLEPLAPPPDGVRDTDVALGIGAKQSMKIEKSSPISQRESDEWGAGTAALYVWGKVEYSDVFKKQHFTNFCLYESGGKMNYSPIGNDAD